MHVTWHGKLENMFQLNYNVKIDHLFTKGVLQETVTTEVHLSFAEISVTNMTYLRNKIEKGGKILTMTDGATNQANKTGKEIFL